MESIAQRLRKLRKVKDYSAKKVAKLANIPATTYREWEYGRMIKGEPYAKLADVFGVSVTELITGQKPSAAKALERLRLIRGQLGELEKDLNSFL